MSIRNNYEQRETAGFAENIMGLSNTKNKIKKDRKCRILKNRNDHSIQKKSPMRIPQTLHKKNQLTFRNKEQQLESKQNSPLILSKNATQKDNISISRMSIGSKKSIYSKKDIPLNDWSRLVTTEQYELIDHLWETTIILGNHNNPIFNKFIRQLQNNIREMIKSIAYSKLDEQVIAMASSQKIKLQNYIAPSHEQKSHVQKEYELSEYSYNSKLEKGEDQIQKNMSELKTAVDQQNSQTSKKLSPKQSAQQLEFKKILYMIDGKKKVSQDLIRTMTVNPSSNNFYYQSLSSFNQNPSEDSGFIVQQIDKFSQYEVGKQNCQSIRVKSQNQLNSEMSLGYSMNLSTRSGRIKTKAEHSSKHKVLHDIISMLNIRYNKNIQLQ